MLFFVLRMLNKLKYAKLFFLIIFFTTSNCFSQNLIQETEKKLASASESEKLTLLLKLSEITLNVNNSQSLSYGQSALALAKELNDVSTIVASEINIGNN